MPSFCETIFAQTKENHTQAENGPLMQKYIHRTIQLSDHVNYLKQQFHIFGALEKALEKAFKKSEKIKEPEKINEFAAFISPLKRQNTIKDDYQYICGLLNIAPEIDSRACPETQEFLRQIDEASNDITKILAYAYVQYLALFNGGIVIKSRIQKLLSEKKLAAGDQEETDQGQTFYIFEQRFFELNAQFKAHINGLDNTVNQNLFIATVKNSYQLNEKVLNALEPPRSSTNTNSFWNNNRNMLAPLVTAAVATSMVVVSYAYNH